MSCNWRSNIGTSAPKGMGFQKNQVKYVGGLEHADQNRRCDRVASVACRICIDSLGRFDAGCTLADREAFGVKEP
jgi:hypothetical protein